MLRLLEQPGSDLKASDAFCPSSTALFLGDALNIIFPSDFVLKNEKISTSVAIRCGE